MAIYHYRVGFVSRSSGRSAVQNAAYITGSQLEETRRDIIADYRNRSSDVIFSATFAPKHASEYMKTLEVWNSLESYEDQYAKRIYRTEATQEKYKSCAQVAQTTVVALPKELTPEVWQELVADFVEERFVRRGFVTTIAIHNDEGNPHAHILISRRTVTEKGEWSLTKDREITTKSALLESRRLWAEKTNLYLAREGHEIRVDHRSYADMGIPFEPTKHENWYAHNLEKSGLDARIIQENKEIRNRNKEYLGFNPENILKELTSKQATFSSLDLAKIIQQRLRDDPKLASYVYEMSLSKAAIVGVGLDGQARYTSQEYIQLENQALEHSNVLMNSKSTISIDKTLQENVLKNDYQYLSVEQQGAVKALCDDNNLSVLIGRAGTGKTTTLKAVIDLHQQSGYKISGLSLSATAAENLGLETNCPAETVAFYLDKWDRREEAYQKFWSIHTSKEHSGLERRLHDLDQYSLTNKHLVIVDEAGMIGTNQWSSILKYVEKSKSKLIVVGDDHQFKAIEAGDFFRKLKEKAQGLDRISNLNSIIRQKEEWMRSASQDLAELKTYQALSTYEQQGHIKKIDGDDLKSIAKSYVEKRISEPEQTGLLLASTRILCQLLNDETRIILKENKLISESDIQINGRSFSIGDEIIFLKNDRENLINCYDTKINEPKDYLVKNGTRGKVLGIDKNSDNVFPLNSSNEHFDSFKLIIEIDRNTRASFNTSNYDYFDHSYAMTLHKAQGKTVDWSMVVASRNMDANSTYVALTRHRKDVTLFYNSNTFNNFKDLQNSLARVSRKDLAIDYSINPEHLNAWENVQEYLLLGQDLSTSAREKDWATYQAQKQERNILGKIILAEWKDHLDYANQSGLSQESIEIACGIKKRPLSLIEKHAQFKVHEYAEKAMEARLLWRKIRKSHPGKHCYEHSKYPEFTQLRQERNLIAEDVTNNKSLYKEFISELGNNLGIGWKTLNSQAKQCKENLSHEYFMNNYSKEKQRAIKMAEHIIDVSKENQILKKYNLNIPNNISDQIFIKDIRTLFDRITFWNGVNGISNSISENQTILEKAVVTEAIKNNAKQEYCFLSTPLEAAIRSEGIALITSELMLQSNRTQNFKKTLEDGAKLYNEQTKSHSQELLDEYKKQYPTVSTKHLASLVDQDLLCKNMTTHKLTEHGQSKVLSAVMALETTLQNKDTSNLKQELSESSSKIIEKEKDNVIEKVLERTFAEKFLSKNTEYIKVYELVNESPYTSKNANILAKDVARDKLLEFKQPKSIELDL